MRLYLDDLPALDREFRKEAGFVARLSEAPENWPQELTSELHKQLPFLSDYEVMVNMERVDAAKGAAFGYADVSNKTERPEMEHTEAGLPHLRIPIVVDGKAVKPFSIILDGERVLPLTENRLREILFNPGAFDLTTAKPQDPNLQDNLQPPSRTGAGMGEVKMASARSSQEEESRRLFEHRLLSGSGMALGAGGGAAHGAWDHGKRLKQDLANGIKMSAEDLKKYKSRRMFSHAGVGAAIGSTAGAVAAAVRAGQRMSKKKAPKAGKKKTASLLRAIGPTVRESDVERFTEKVASDASLIAGFRRSGIASTLVDALEKTKRASAEERLEAVAGSILPTVITLQKLPGGDFLVKSANVNAFQPNDAAAGQVVPQEEAAQAIGPENAEAMQPGQTMTLSTGALQAELEQRNVKPADEFGQWLVQDQLGNSLMGWVFPKTLAWDGSFTPQDIALFTNGSAYAFQDSVQGELVGKGVTLPEDEPRGDGCFYVVGGGKAIATAPITIQSSMAGPDGSPKLQGIDAFGNPVVASFQDGIQEPMRVTDTEYAFPSSWKFMRLNNQTQLAGGGMGGHDDPGMAPPEEGAPDALPEPSEKLAAARDAGASATLFYNGAWQLDGGCGLHKLASDWYQDMDPMHAEFMLGLLGLEGRQAKQKVAEARKKGSVKLAGLRTVYLMGEQLERFEKKAAAFLAELPDLRRDLTKEASVIEDTGTVDHLLALNFVNPENLSTFVGYIPELEETSEKLAEMLLTCYLGQKQVPEAALERAMKGLEEVLEGLKAVGQSQAQPEA